jgi:glyoxylase-like metal-dependent hydrolase (beta-lactamase superfamily II)
VPSLPASYRRLYGGDSLVIGGREWEVITGYGHSPSTARCIAPRPAC